MRPFVSRIPIPEVEINRLRDLRAAFSLLIYRIILIHQHKSTNECPTTSWLRSSAFLPSY